MNAPMLYPFENTTKAGVAYDRLSGQIAQGKAKMIDMLTYLDEHQPEDAIVPASVLQFSDAYNSDEMRVTFGDSTLGLHRHAMVQAAERAGMPSAARVLDWADKNDTREWLANILTTRLAEQSDRRFLLRAVSGQVRGFLSDRFRRLDSRPIVDALLTEAVTGYGAMPIETHVGDTRVHFKMLLPRIFEPVPGELMCFGLTFKNSDYGQGKLDVTGFVLRLVCLNGMLGTSAFNQVHLGGRLTEEIEFSQRTYELDTETTVSAVRDVTQKVLAPASIEQHCLRIQEASKEDGFNASAAIKALTGKKLTKADANRVTELYTSADIEMMPQGRSPYRLAQAIALFAHESDDKERALELEQMAGEMAGVAS